MKIALTIAINREGDHLTMTTFVRLDLDPCALFPATPTPFFDCRRICLAAMLRKSDRALPAN
jgi:hypothetical protein